MYKTSLPLFGIYPAAIDAACMVCEFAMEQNGLGDMIDEMYENAEYYLQEYDHAATVAHLTNAIISAVFGATSSIIRDKCPDKNVDYFVNCYDSHFYIDGEEVL